MGKKLRQLEIYLRQLLVQQRVVDEKKEGEVDEDNNNNDDNNNKPMYPLLEEKEEVLEELSEEVPKEMVDKSTSCSGQIGRRLLSDDIQGTFLIQTWHGTWLVPNLEQNTVECVDEKPGVELAWTIIKWGHKVVFQCAQDSDRFLRHDINNNVFNISPRSLDWETFVPQKNAYGSFCFQSHHDLWIQVNEDKSITAADRSNYFTHVFLVDI